MKNRFLVIFGLILACCATNAQAQNVSFDRVMNGSGKVTVNRDSTTIDRLKLQLFTSGKAVITSISRSSYSFTGTYTKGSNSFFRLRMRSNLNDDLDANGSIYLNKDREINRVLLSGRNHGDSFDLKFDTFDDAGTRYRVDIIDDPIVSTRPDYRPDNRPDNRPNDIPRWIIGKFDGTSRRDKADYELNVDRWGKAELTIYPDQGRSKKYKGKYQDDQLVFGRTRYDVRQTGRSVQIREQAYPGAVVTLNKR